jgi:GWxTD domain-containing protein
MPGLEGQQVRRLAAIAAAVLGCAAAACGPSSRAGTDPAPEAGRAVPKLFDALSVYQSMGLLVAGPPLPFVASFRYLADASPESTLVVCGLSLANHALSFRRDGAEFLAQYHVEVAFRGDTTPVRQVRSDETVRVRTFQETLRADESVIFQQFVGLPPGVYRISVLVRDRGGTSSSRTEGVDTVPRLAGRALAAPIPIYAGTGRTTLAEVPKLVVNPRGTLPYGADSARFYVEAYGVPAAARAAARVLDKTGEDVWRDTISFAGDAHLATARIVLRPSDLSVGQGELAVRTLAGPDLEARTPILVSFSDQWALTNFEAMVNLLRYFERQDWVARLREAGPEQRSKLWREFFQATDPVPITPENEALDEYFRRVQVANERFQEAGDAGWLTDRGEVYISLGEPDEVYDFSADVARTGARGIRWTYNSLRLTLFFQDQSGFGRFRLTPLSRAEFQRVLTRVRRSG